MARMTKTKVKRVLPMVGWRETLSLPELGVTSIQAKIDTGASTSAIHAYRVEEVVVDGALYVSFFLHPVKRRAKPEISCRALVADQRWIKSSNGEREKRYVVATVAKLGDMQFPLQLTLTNRDEMGFRMLLGREALRKRFTVNPAASYLLSQKP